MSKRRVQDEGKLRDKYKEKNPPKQSDDEKIDELFDELDKATGQQVKAEKEADKKAIKTYKDLIVQRFEEIKWDDVIFKFRINPTALEFEQRAMIDDPKEKMAYLHQFLVEPEMPLEDFLQLPPQLPKYIEQKIMENFLQGLVQIALQN